MEGGISYENFQKPRGGVGGAGAGRRGQRMHRSEPEGQLSGKGASGAAGGRIPAVDLRRGRHAVRRHGGVYHGAQRGLGREILRRGGGGHRRQHSGLDAGGSGKAAGRRLEAGQKRHAAANGAERQLLCSLRRQRAGRAEPVRHHAGQAEAVHRRSLLQRRL